MTEKHYIITLKENLSVSAQRGNITRNSNSTQWLDVELDGWKLNEGDVLFIELSHTDEDAELTTIVGPLQLFYNFELQRYVTLAPPEFITVPGDWLYSIELRFNISESRDAPNEESKFIYDSITSGIFELTVQDSIITATKSNKFVKEEELISAARAMAAALAVGYTAEDVFQAANEARESEINAANSEHNAGASALAAANSEANAEKFAILAAENANSLNDYKNRTVQFVKELPDAGQDERTLYAVVTDIDSNLFDLWAWKNGAWEHLGGENILVNGNKTYSRTLISNAGWNDKHQVIEIPDLDSMFEVTVYPSDLSAADYIKFGVTAEHNGTDIVFECKNVPNVNIDVLINVVMNYEMPSLRKYYTAIQTDTEIANAINNIVDGAPETYDTFKEIAEYIAEDKSGTVELLSKVNKNAADVEKLREDVNASIEEETATREVADDNLQIAINNEANARISADSALLDNITEEAELRSDADADLLSKLEAEEQNRLTADNTLRNYIDSELNKKQNKGDYPLRTEMNVAITNAVNGIIDGAPAAYDTFKEVADYISSDKTGTAELLKKVNKNSSDIALLKAAATVADAVVVNIAANRWNNKTVTLNSSDNQIIGSIKQSSYVELIAADESASLFIKNGIRASNLGEGTVTLTCSSTPTAGVSAILLILT